MSGREMPTSPASASKGFSSTPLKSLSAGKDLHRSGSVGEYVLSDDDTYSLLSPIYHHSFDSDEDPGSAARHPFQTDTSSRQSEDSRLSISPIRCELPKTHTEKAVAPATDPVASPTLSAWEMWLVNKAKDDRLKLEEKAVEEHLLKEKKEQEKREQEQKKLVVEEKIQEWLKTKREQEKLEKELKLSQEQEEIQRQKAKQRETEQRAQQKYKEWLRKKNQHKLEEEKREKEEAARREEQEKERRKMAEESFKEWLASTNEKSRASAKSPCYPRSPYDKAYPSPSFYNPVPWKPIHTPPPETPPKNTSRKKLQSQTKYRQSPGSTLRLRNSVSAAQLLHRR